MAIFLQRLPAIFLMASIGLMAACQGERELVSGLSENDANEILVALDSQDITAQKTAVPGRSNTFTYTVLVRGSDQNRALKLLVDNHLPPMQSLGLAQIYPPGGGGLIPTRGEENARFLMAVQGEIENMLKILPGVVKARVVIVLPDTDSIRDVGAPKPRATASVAIVYNPIEKRGKPVLSGKEIKELVASAVEDLSEKDVSVVMTINRPRMIITGTGEQDAAQKGSVTSPATTFDGATKEPPEMVLGVSTPAVVSPQEVEQMHQLEQELSAMKTQLADEQEKGRWMIWGFAGLAGLGLCLGIFGLIRSIILRSKLLRVQKELATAQIVPVEEPAVAQEP